MVSLSFMCVCGSNVQCEQVGVKLKLLTESVLCVIQKFSFVVFLHAKYFFSVYFLCYGISWGEYFVHVYKTAKLVEYNLPHEVPYIDHMHSPVHSAVPAHNN